MRVDGQHSQSRQYAALGGGAVLAAAGAAVPAGAHVGTKRAEAKAEQLYASLNVPELRTEVPPFRPAWTVTHELTFPDVPTSPIPHAVTEAAAGSIVEVDHDTGHGSGWAVAPDLIVTDHHVVDGDPPLNIFRQGHRHPGPVQVVAVDPARDLALLHVPGIDLPPLPTADRPPDARRALQMLGHPGKAAGRVIGEGANADLAAIDTTGHGRVAGTWGGGHRVSHLQSVTDDVVPMLFGASGGPVIDSEGVVRGVTHSGQDLVQGPHAGKLYVKSTDVLHVNELVAGIAPKLDAWRTALGSAPEGVLDAARAAGDNAEQLAHIRKVGGVGGAIAAVGGVAVAASGFVSFE